MARPVTLFALFPALLVGCARDTAPAPDAPAATPASSPQTAVDQLSAMDPRTPVPLQPMMAWHQKQNMQEHLVAIQEITDGLARQDWDAVTAAAEKIGPSPQMQMQCEHMGAGAEGFTDDALEFHRRAEAIKTAAHAKDTAAVLAATAHTLESCTSCHQTWRQDVVDADTWQARTGQVMDHGGG